MPEEDRESMQAQLTLAFAQRAWFKRSAVGVRLCAIDHWEIRKTMKELEVEMIVQRAREQFPGERLRMISDNGPQFVSEEVGPATVL